MSAGDKYCGRCGKPVASMTPCCIVWEGEVPMTASDIRIRQLEAEVASLRRLMHQAFEKVTHPLNVLNWMVCEKCKVPQTAQKSE
jgi:hypothetical protein